jgi:small subunit ribosomal protein S1
MSAAKKAVLDAAQVEDTNVVPMSIMADLAARAPEPPKEGDIVEGPVIALDRARLYIDLPPFGTGIIFGREYLNAREVIKRTNVGDRIAAKVISVNSKEGYIELSLKEARQALIWAEAEAAVKEKRQVELTVKEANKGGLIMEWQGIMGFLPASQLKAEHYPRVVDGDKDKILDELRKLVGTRLVASIISATPKEGKLIFSEKGVDDKEKRELIASYQVGDTVDGEVTGMVDFGAFVKLEEGLEGLVHISEIDWGLVDDPRHFFKVGDKVKVKIIDIKEGKISLSVKQLKNNPWQIAVGKYNKGDKVEGVVIKFNKHGALASIEEGIAGLVHVSEFGSEEKLRANLELGHRYPFTISLFEPKDMRMALAYAGDKK